MNTSQSDICIFCRIINKEIPSYIIFEDENTLGVLDRNPINQGHILLIPKTHEEYVFNLPNDTYLQLMKTTKSVATMMKEKTKAKRIGLAIEGFGVPHTHIHLVPVNNGNELNPERAKSATDANLKFVQEKIYNVKK